MSANSDAIKVGKKVAKVAGLAGIFMGAVGSAVYGLPLAAVGVAAVSSGIGAAAASVVAMMAANAVLKRQDHGNEAVALILHALGQVAAVPTGVFVASRYALKATGFVP